MNTVKKVLSKIKYYRVITFGIILILLIIALVTGLMLRKGRNSLADQNYFKRWDKDGYFAQISFFIKENYYYNDERIAEFEYNLTEGLKDKGVTPEDENDKLFIDCYSGKSSVTISNDVKTQTVNCIVAGGDFFGFHPLQLVSGSYFYEDDLMKDGLIIDEETAWQMFGSSDVAGKELYIGDRAVYVKGVYHRDQSDLYVHAHGTDPEIFISYELMHEVAEEAVPPITVLEALIVNPVENFASSAATDAFKADDSFCEMVVNSERYSVSSLWKVAKERKYRAMQNGDILLPYWERIARYEEEVLAPKAVIMSVCLIAAGVIAISLIVYELTILTRFNIKENDPD